MLLAADLASNIMSNIQENGFDYYGGVASLWASAYHKYALKHLTITAQGSTISLSKSLIEAEIDLRSNSYDNFWDQLALGISKYWLAISDFKTVKPGFVFGKTMLAPPAVLSAALESTFRSNTNQSLSWSAGAQEIADVLHKYTTTSIIIQWSMKTGSPVMDKLI